MSQPFDPDASDDEIVDADFYVVGGEVGPVEPWYAAGSNEYDGATGVRVSDRRSAARSLDAFDAYGIIPDTYCCRGECCGPGSWCCARAGKHDHDE